MEKKYLLEIACFNIESALIAQDSGADRIEFCESYREGGVSPDLKKIKEVRERLRIPVNVMIRPRNGNFIYSVSEFEEMKKTVLFCRSEKINGVVFGALTNENEVHRQICSELVKLAKPMQTVFHRAIDETVDYSGSIRTLIELGLDAVLTSGGQKSALEGSLQLGEIQTDFGHQIKIIAGGGIRSSNIRDLRKSNCRAYHSSAIIAKGEIADPNEVKKLKSVLEE